jgi:hypothetical protein
VYTALLFQTEKRSFLDAPHGRYGENSPLCSFLQQKILRTTEKEILKKSKNKSNSSNVIALPFALLTPLS